MPAELPNTIKQLDDQEFDRLLAAVLAEQKRRGRKLADSNECSRKKRVEEIDISLAQGKLNAVRAAFKAGVTPSRIVRQFGNAAAKGMMNSRRLIWGSFPETTIAL